MKLLHSFGKPLSAGLLLAYVFISNQSLHAQPTWSGLGVDDNWSTVENWSVLPVNGDTLTFDGGMRLVNTNNLLSSVGGINFSAGGFSLRGDGLSFTTSAITNSVGTSEIALGMNWGLAGNLHVEPGTELILSGVLTNPFSSGGSNVVYRGGGRVRYTGGYLQASNNPATIINNAEVVVDGGTFVNGGGVRIASDVGGVSSKLILTNGATMSQINSAGAIRVGDLAGITGTLVIDNSRVVIASGGSIHIPFATGQAGAVLQKGGTNTGGTINFNNGAGATTGSGTYDMIGGVLETVQIKKASTNASPTASMSFDGSTIRALAASTTFFTGLTTAEIKSGGLTFDDNGFAETIGQLFIGAGGFTKKGTGTLTMTALNSYAGATVLQAGEVVLNATSTLGTGALHFNGGILSVSANRAVTTAGLVNPIRMSSNTVISANVTGTGTRNLPFNSGDIQTTGGTLTISNTAATGTASFNVRFAGGGFDFTRPIVMAKAIPGSAVQLDVFGLNTDSPQVFSGVISGPGSVRRSSSSDGTGGTTIFSGANTYTGNNALNGGFIGFGSSSVVIDNVLVSGPIGVGTLTVANDSTVGFSAYGGSQTVANPITLGSVLNLTIGGTNHLTLSGPFNLATTARIFTMDNTGITTLSGVVSGTATLTKAGAGTLVLSGNNGYSGATTVSTGLLQVDGISSTSGITVSAAGTLGGSGTAGSVVLNGKISPGSSPGTLNTGSETWNGGGTYVWEINDATGTAGANPGWDKLAITGDLTIAATSGNKFNIDVTSLAGAVAGNAANFDNSLDYTWVIATTTSGITGFDASAFNLVDNFSNAEGTGEFLVAVVGNDLVIKFSHAPIITADPVSQTKTVGESVTFTVESDGTTYQWRKNSSNISGATDSSYTISSLVAADAGSYDVVVGNGSGATTTSTAATLTVNKADQTIVFNALANRVYGDVFTVSATATSSLPVSYSIVSGPASIAGDSVTVTGLGEITVRASQSGSADYNAAPDVDQSFTATAAPLAVTADSFSRAYGSENSALTVSYSGFKLGETLATSDVTGAPLIATLADTNSAPGIYLITVTADTLASAGHYTLSFIDGSLTVTQAVLTVTADSYSRAYGSADPALTVSYSGFVNDQELNTSDVTGAPAFAFDGVVDASSPVGSYAITNSIGTLSSINYSFAIVDGSLTVTGAVLTVTADNANRVYGSSNPSFTASYTGFVNGETTAVLTGSPSLTTGATAGSSVGSYDIVAAAGDLAAANYTFSFVNGTLNIAAAPLTVTSSLASGTKVYGAAPSLAPSYSGFVNGDTEAVLSGSPVLSTLVETNSPVAGNPYLITVTTGDLASPNYNISAVDGSLNVTPAPLTVTANDTNRAVGVSNPTFTASYTGFVNDENETDLSGSPSLTTAANEASPAGSYPIVAAVGTLAAPNYALTFVDGTLLVGKIPLTVSATNNSVYGSTPALTPTYTGFVDGDTEDDLTGAPTLSTTATATSPVSGSPYVITVGLGTLSSEKYEITAANGELTVTAATLTVTADNKSRAYGDANPAFTASYSGFVNSEDAGVLSGSPDLSATATSVSPVSGSPYAITAAVGTLTASNYIFAFVDGELTVGSAVLTVTADNQSRAYGSANPTLTASYTGFVNGEDQTALSGSPDLSTTADAGSSVAGSPYVITAAVGTLSSANYSLAFVDGSLTVTSAVLTVTADNANRVYGSSNPSFTASYTGFVNGETVAVLTGAPDLTTTATEASPAGDYDIVAAIGTLSAANYTFSFINGTLAVAKAPLTITANNFTRNFGEENPTLTSVYSGFVNGDTEAVLTGAPSLTTTATSGSSGGVYAITVDVGTLVADNYSFSYVNGTLTILQAPAITVQPQNQSVAPGATATFSVTATGYPLSYQWSRNGVEISGATDSSYAVVASAGTVGFYSVVVSNGMGSVTSTAASLNINSKILLFDNFDSYANQAAFEAVWPKITANSGTLTTSTSSSAPQSIGIDLTGTQRNGRSFTESGVPAPTNVITFSFDFYDTNSAAAPSRQYGNLQDTTAPGSYGQLVSMGLNNNHSVTTDGGNYYMARILSVAVGTNAASAYFKLNDPGAPLRSTGWHNLKVVISNTDFKFYVDGVLAKTVANAGTLRSYDNVRLGSGVSATSLANFDNYNVSVTAPGLNITAQPQNITTNAGSTVVFSVTAPGATVYQWKKNGSEISGATASSLTLTNVLDADEGSYSVYVENGFSATNSTAGVLTVIDPAINVQPLSQSKTVGENVTFTVVAAGTGTLSYQWKIGGSDITGATDSSYSINSVQLSDSEVYSVLVTGVNGFVLSSNATLTVSKASQTIAFNAVGPKTYGDSVVTLSATASSTLPVTYSLISGPATLVGDQLTLTGAGNVTVQSAQAGDATYNAAQTNQTFSVSPAVLTVSADNQTRAAGATNPVLTVSYNGFVNGETLGTSDVTGSPVLSTTADTNSAPGTYVISTANGTLSSVNYSFNLVNGQLIVEALLAPTNLVMTVAGEGSFSGSPNSQYTAEYAEELGSPTVWETLTTVTTDNSGVGTFIDVTDPATESQRYYRIAVPAAP